MTSNSLEAGPLPKLPQTASTPPRRQLGPGPELQRRYKAAGLPETSPEDIEESRDVLTRRIAMIMNEFHGCPEPLCRRHRGCMAPSGVCTNAKPLASDESDEDWGQALFEIRQAIAEILAQYRDARD